MRVLLSSILLSSILLIVAISSISTASEQCDLFDKIAYAVMKARQSGVVMSEIVNISEKSNDDKVEKIFLKIIQLAYEKPRFSTEEFQQRAITDFRNEVYLSCIMDEQTK